MDLEEEIELDEGLEEILPEDEKEAVEDVSEPKERLFESDQWKVVSQYPSGKEEAGKETVPGKGMEEAVVEEPEPATDLEEEIKLDEAVEEVVSEEDIGKLKEPLLEKAVERETPVKEEATEEIPTEVPPIEGKLEAEEEAVREEAPPVSEEKIETLLGKVVIDVLEKVARKIISEVAEKIIREEIDALKKRIMPED